MKNNKMDEFVNSDDGEVTLKVLEAYTKDVGRGVARIDYDSMDTLSASTGDVIELKGKIRTVAKCLPLYPSDGGKGIIRIDGLIRDNLAINIGDVITLKKIHAVPAEKVIVYSLDDGFEGYIDDRYLSDALENIPLTKGDEVLVQYFGGRSPFKVIGVTPAADAVVVTRKTSFRQKRNTVINSPDEIAILPLEKHVLYCVICGVSYGKRMQSHIWLRCDSCKVRQSIGSKFNEQIMETPPDGSFQYKQSVPLAVGKSPVADSKSATATKSNAQLGLNKPEEVIEYCDKVLDLDPHDMKAWARKTDAMVKLGRHEEVIQCCDKAIALSPVNRGQQLNSKCNALMELNKYEEIIEYCDKAFEINPYIALILRHKLIAQTKLGINDIDEQELVSEIDSETVVLLMFQGNAFSNISRFEEAVVCYNTVLKIEPKNDLAMQHRAFCIFKIG